MLSEIRIENAALIREAQVRFSGGFCAITGQTGAGKSVFIRALGLLRGEKAPPRTVSEGESECRVTGLFTDLGSELMAQLAESGLCDPEDDCLSLSRFVKADGKSRCLVNARTVPLSVLKEVGAKLLQLHSQHGTYLLTDESTHLSYVDALGDGEHRKKTEDYRICYDSYRSAQKKLDDTEKRVREAQAKKDWLRSVVKELSGAALKENEEDRLWEKYRTLENRGKISAAAAYVRQAISGGEKQKGAYDRVMLASARLEGMEEIGPEFGKIASRLEEIGYELESVMQELDEACPEDGEDAARLMEKISDRIGKIRRWKQKYGSTEAQINDFLEKSREELEAAESGAGLVKKLKSLRDAALEQCIEKGKILEESRRKIADELCAAVDEKLRFLDMEKARFFVDFAPLELPSAAGLSAVRFLIQSNAGQQAAGLGSIASGGELSRIMLALKSVLAADSEDQVLIFDEIDTGISGKTARKIGILLRSISVRTQIIAVTHSAQIASLAGEHYLLKKEVVGDSTVSSARRLNREERVEELARILGGLDITDAVRRNALELLEE